VSRRQSATRQARRELRRQGCTCHPAITPVDKATARANGAVAGGMIRHETGCTLGDHVLRLNRLGLFPALYTTATRCDR